MVDTQLWSTWSQMPEQHSLAAPQDRPVARHAPPLASTSAPPEGPSDAIPPQLATTNAMLESQNERADMTILPVGPPRAQSRSTRRPARERPHRRPAANSVPALELCLYRSSLRVPFEAPVVTRVTTWLGH
jgi:hypothetical protein